VMLAVPGSATNFRLTEIFLDATPKSPLRPSPIPSHQGALAIVTNEGRVAVDAAASGACRGRRAGLSSVSERSAQTTGANVRMNLSAKTGWSCIQCKPRHCERSEAIHLICGRMDCFAALAMTNAFIRNNSQQWLLRVSGDCTRDRRLMFTTALLNGRP
jgi:hypothetical protein